MATTPDMSASTLWASPATVAPALHPYNTVSGALTSVGGIASNGVVDLGLSSRADRPRIGNDFFDRNSNLADQCDGELRHLLGLNKPSNETWTVSVAPSRSTPGVSAKRRNREREQRTLILYVSTPTSSLTLSRSIAQITELESNLRSDFPGRVPPRNLRRPATPPMTPKKRVNVFASLQRSLTPRRGFLPASIDESDDSSVVADATEIGAWLTKLTNDTVLRDHSSFKSFFAATGEDDLESARLERRIKRTKSDLTTRLHPRRQHSHLGDDDDDEANPVQSLRHTRLRSTDDHGAEVGVVPADHVRLFPLPSIPSSKLDFDVDEERRAALTGKDLIGFDDKGEAPLSTTLADGAQARGFELPALVNGQDILELPSRPRTAQDDGVSVRGPRSSRTIELPGTALSTTGNVTPSTRRTSKASNVLTIDSFEILRVLGKGCAGKVLLVRQRDTGSLYALKAIHKQHVLAHRELAHTKTEQAVLKACSRDHTVNPFVVKLHYSFHDRDTLYLALDFHPGGDLATQLARWGRLGRDRARFYTAEIVEGVQGLHNAGIIYRDLKPENVLISAEGHVVLTDFGLSKDFGHERRGRSFSTHSEHGLPVPRPQWLSSKGERSVSTPPSSSWSPAKRETTSTFCGTAEYLAPEVLLGEPYSYEVDAWSLGTMLWEMLAGVTPFWSEDHATMYRRVLHEDLVFDDESRIFDDDTKSLLRGLLQRDPLLRMTDERIQQHPYFRAIVWEHVYYRRYVPPFVPTLNPEDPSDTSQFDEMFLSMPNEIGEAESIGAGSGRDSPEGDPEPAFDQDGRDVFDGYSYYGRDSDSVTSIPLETSDLDGLRRSAPPMEEDVLNAPVLATRTGEGGTSQATKISPTPDGDESRAGEQPDGAMSVSVLSEKLSTTALDVGASSSVTVDDDQSDSEWDVVDREPAAPTARNGGRETTLWARGFKDKYRLVLVAPRGAVSPLRIPSNVSRTTFREGSSAASSPQPSPSSTPDPSRQSLKRRLTSGRSGNTARGMPDLTTLAALSRGAAGAQTGAMARQPPKAGVTLKRLKGLSGFRPSKHSSTA